MNVDEDNFNRALALQLRLLREGAQLSQADLAERLGLHRNTIFKWEQGEGQIPTIVFLRLCALLDANAGKVLQTILATKGKFSHERKTG